ncbi:MAG: VOC family protein [Actinobacteria bacterium]|nr:VOC family protein [Actinomycetota bacterium]
MTTTTDQDIETPGQLPFHRRVRQEAGPATGRISGINHLVMFTRDMNQSVRFYRDLMGFRVVRTLRFQTSADGLRSTAHHSSGSAVQAEEANAVAVNMTVYQVFFEMGNGELFSLYETPEARENPDAPVSSVLWPAGGKARCSRPAAPQKLDHLAFDVATHQDVEWFRRHLLAHGVEVSDLTERRGADNTHRFITSIYFFDPSGNPLEISSFNRGDEAWHTYDFSDWFIDETPVEALVEGVAEDARIVPPRWARPNMR